MRGIAVTGDESVAAFLRKAARNTENRIAREIPREELRQHAPKLSAVVAAFEPADHVMFGPAATGEFLTPPAEKRNQGFWPLRHDYKSVFAIAGPGVVAGPEPEMQMLAIAGRLAALLGIRFD